MTEYFRTAAGVSTKTFVDGVTGGIEPDRFGPRRSERLERIHRRHLAVVVVDGALEVIRPAVVDDDDRAGVVGGAPFVAGEHRVKNERDGEADREHEFPQIFAVNPAPWCCLLAGQVYRVESRAAIRPQAADIAV